MTFSEIVQTVKKSPYEQRLSLIETLAQSLLDDKKRAGSQTSSLTRVKGMLKVNDVPQTSQMLEDDYTDYLIEKYS